MLEGMLVIMVFAKSWILRYINIETSLYKIQYMYIIYAQNLAFFIYLFFVVGHGWA